MKHVIYIFVISAGAQLKFQITILRGNKMNSLKDYKISFIAAVIIIIIGGLILIIMASNDESKYNDGVCSDCGGTYKFKQAIGHQVTTDYLYICDKCGRAIEVSKYYPPK